MEKQWYLQETHFDELMARFSIWLKGPGGHPRAFVALDGALLSNIDNEDESCTAYRVYLREAATIRKMKQTDFPSPDAIGRGYATGRQLLWVLNEFNDPLALTRDCLRIADDVLALKTCALLASVASGFADVAIASDRRPFTTDDIGALESKPEDFAKFGEYLSILRVLIFRYHIALHCWMHFVNIALGDAVRGKLFRIALGTGDSIDEYGKLLGVLRSAVSRVRHGPVESSYYDAIEAEEFLRDYLTDSLVDIKSLSSQEIVSRSLKGAYGWLRFRDRFKDHVASRPVSARASQIAQNLDYNLIAEVHDRMYQESDEEQSLTDRMELLEEVGSLNEDARNLFSQEGGKHARAIIELALFNSEVQRKKGGINQTEIARRLGIHPNTVRNTLNRLRGLDQEQLFEVIFQSG